MKKCILAVSLVILSVFHLNARSHDWSYAESYIQYIPPVAAAGLGFTGVQAKHNFPQRAVVVGVSSLSTFLISRCILKPLITEERPDGANMHSFPSGHTATAFMGAEIVRREYGWGWGAGAYALAVSVGVLRVQHNRHWVQDAVGGAFVGVLSASIGYWSLPAMEKLLKIQPKENVTLTLYPTVDNWSGTLCAGMSVRF